MRYVSWLSFLSVPLGEFVGNCGNLGSIVRVSESQTEGRLWSSFGRRNSEYYVLFTYNAFCISTQPLRQAKKFKTFIKFDAANIIYKYNKCLISDWTLALLSLFRLFATITRSRVST